MKIKILVSIILMGIILSSLESKTHKSEKLLKILRDIPSSKQEKINLRKEILNKGNAAIPILIKVMKSSDFPDNNRWMATFLMVKIMGNKASHYLSKFLDHPNWVMRMASLKALTSLKEKKYTESYSRLLRDKSLMVRLQALETVNQLKLKSLAPDVWGMIFDAQNYQKLKNGAKKRMSIIKRVIRTVGDLKYQKAFLPLKKMMGKERYQDLFQDLDYSLSKLTGLKPPRGDIVIKKKFWGALVL